MRDHNDDIWIDEDGSFTIKDDYVSGDTISIDVSSISGITTSTVDYNDLFLNDDFNITINEPVEFEDTMPDVAKIEDMCNDYPGLRKAYENFKAIYKMVHQDWQGRQDAEDQFPF